MLDTKLANLGALLCGFLEGERFAALCAEYEAKWSVELGILDAAGSLYAGRAPENDPEQNAELYAMLMGEAVRWGEARFDLVPSGGMIWVVPLMCNERLVGGVLAHSAQGTLLVEEQGGEIDRAYDAAKELRLLLEGENLTNASFLLHQRRHHRTERRLAEAIHSFKNCSSEFRLTCLREMQSLNLAVKKGNLDEARDVIHRVVFHLGQQGGASLPLVKSFLALLLGTTCGAAFEMGCDVYELLDQNYNHYQELMSLSSEHALHGWTERTIGDVLAMVKLRKNTSSLSLLQRAITYMHSNLDRDITRDEVAAIANLSPAHFTYLLKRELNENFTTLLSRIRVNHAAGLMANTSRSLSVVALESGFRDQSYFTKVFRKYRHETPREYRCAVRAAQVMAGSGGR